VAVYVVPNTITPGHDVRVIAFCDPGQGAIASVNLPGMPSVSLTPGYGGVTGSMTIPPDVPTGKYLVTAVCDSADNGTATIWVISTVIPVHGPNTGGGGTAAGIHAAPRSDPPAALLGLIGGVGVVLAGSGLFAVCRRRG
jgi:hypothetical protein